MDKLEPKELKTLLNLISYPDYHARRNDIRPNSKTNIPELEKICLSLADKGLVECSFKIKKFKIAPPGNALLKQEQSALPVSDNALKVLGIASKAKKFLNPGDTRIPADKRQDILEKLEKQGMIDVSKEVAEIRLSEHGRIFLKDQYACKGTNPVLSLNHLSHYITFLRQELVQPTSLAKKPDDSEILQIIQELDQNFGTGNYVPIFRLREQLQPPLSRKELDQALYRLVRENKIELSALQDNMSYNEAQLAAGIPQDIGGSLFYIIIL